LIAGLVRRDNGVNNDEIYSLLRQGEILEVESALHSVKKWDKKLIILSNLLEIFHDEVNCEVKRTVFDYSTDIDELVKYYTWTKLMLRRIEFDMPHVYIDEFYDYCENNGVSMCMLNNMINKNIFFKKKVCLGLADLYGEKKGSDSWEREFYIKFSERVEDKINVWG
jgi:hypothetical protein